MLTTSVALATSIDPNWPFAGLCKKRTVYTMYTLSISISIYVWDGLGKLILGKTLHSFRKCKSYCHYIMFSGSLWLHLGWNWPFASSIGDIKYNKYNQSSILNENVCAYAGTISLIVAILKHHIGHLDVLATLTRNDHSNDVYEFCMKLIIWLRIDDFVSTL